MIPEPDRKNGGSIYETLPSHYYTDNETFDREDLIVFRKSWHLVGHQSLLPNIGDFRVVEVSGQSLILVRGEDKHLRAFYNFCIHRGHELVEGSGCQKLFRCPYHAWSYDSMGRLASVPHAERYNFDVKGKALKSVTLEILNGLVFVNLGEPAESLKESLGVTSDEICAYLPHLQHCVHAHNESKLLAANWKVVVENFNECYHCPSVHKHLAENLLDLGDFRLIDRGNSFLHCPFSQCEKNQILKQEPSQEEKQTTFATWWIWPLCAIQHYPGGVAMTFRWSPVSVGQTRVEVDWWLASETPTPYEAQLIQDHSSCTLPEDFPIVESVQRSLVRGGFDRGYLLVDENKSALSEHGVKGFQDRYRAVMRLTE